MDLGSVQSLSKVVLDWEAAYGSAYEIRVSTDGGNWTTAAAVTGGDDGIDEIDLDTSSRYLRLQGLQGLQHATGYGYSLWRLEAY